MNTNLNNIQITKTKQVLFTIFLAAILVISSILIMNHNKQIKPMQVSNIHSNIFTVTKVFYNQQEKNYYMHTESLRELPFELPIKDIQADNPSDSMMENLNEAFTGSRVMIKYNNNGTINQLDDQIINYSFLDNETYFQKGTIKNSILDKDNLYINMVETEEGQLYKFYTHDQLQKDQNITLEIDNDTGAIFNIEF